MPPSTGGLRVSLSLHDFCRAPSGLFVLKVYRRGELIEVFEQENLIVNGSKQTHARLLGGDVTTRSETQLGFGPNPAAPTEGNKDPHAKTGREPWREKGGHIEKSKG